MDINIGQGFGAIRFRMAKPEVEALLGAADACSFIEDIDGESVEVLQYNCPQVSLFFDCNGGLSSMDIEDADCTLFGEPVFRCSRQEIVSLMLKHGFSEVEVDEEAWGETCLSIPAAGLDFYFESDSLVSVSLGQ